MSSESYPETLRAEKHTKPVLFKVRVEKHHWGTQTWKTCNSTAVLLVAEANCPLVYTNGYLGI